METALPAQTKPAAAGLSIWARLLGLLLVLPALTLGCLTVTLPALATFRLSLEQNNLITAPKAVGLKNYTSLFASADFRLALLSTLREIGVAVLLAGIVLGLLAWGAGRLSRRARLGARLLFSLPLAGAIPVFWALTWRAGLGPIAAIGQPLEDWLGHPAVRDPWLVPFIIGIIVLGLAGGLAAPFLISARQSSAEAPRRRSLSRLVWALSLLALAGVLLQDLLFPQALFTVTLSSLSTLASEIFRLSFHNMQLGMGAALSCVVLLIAALLGLAAALLVILSRVEIRLAEGQPEAAAGRPNRAFWLGAALFVLLAGLSLAAAASAAEADGFGQAGARPNLASGLVVTLLLALPAFLVQLPVAYLAALGIGGLRPLGRFSEWLLLPFGAGLFLTALPFTTTGLVTLRDSSLLNTLTGELAGGVALNAPMLFILTLFFKGQHGRWLARQAQGEGGFGAWFETVVLPSLPLAGLLALAAGLAYAWDLTWPPTVALKPATQPLSVLLLVGQATTLVATAGAYARTVVLTAGYGWVMLLILVFYQLFYLDRLELN